MATTELKTTTEIKTLDDLVELVGQPSERVKCKVQDRIDQHARTLIAHSPFVLLATASAKGTCDVSPRGDPAGSVLVVDDHTLVLADRPGNKLHDSFRNILENPHAGLLFLIPGMNETLRVNGRATLVSDAPYFDSLVVRGKRPRLAVVIEVDELYMHCAKAFLRSSLWQPQTWPDRATLPTLGEILKDQMALPIDAGDMDKSLEDSNRNNQY